jgi:hypothetical protein
MTKRGADSIETMGGFADVHTLHDLSNAKDFYARVKDPDTGELDALRSQISVLKALERDLMANTKEAQARALERVNSIGQKLADSSGDFNPFLRATVEAAHANGGSLTALDTDIASEFLAIDLMEVDERLRASKNSVPVITVSDNPAFLSPHRDLGINYGFTVPGEGLVPKTDNILIAHHASGDKTYAPHPVIEIPTVSDTSLGAVTAPSWNSHYIKSRGRSVELGSHGRKSRIKLHKGEAKPRASDLTVPLPVGSLSLKESTTPLMSYDVPGHRVESIYAPRDFSGRHTKTVAFIGPRAVRQGLEELYYFSNASESEHNPLVVKDMVLFVASSLGMVMKRKQLNRIERQQRQELLEVA